MAIYGNRKPVSCNPRCVVDHRARCSHHVDELSSDDVTAIGVRIPASDDDPDVDCILRGLTGGSGKTLYVSPDGEDRKKALAAGFDNCRAQTFRAFVSSIE
jgi:hypothetical protein